MRLYRNWPNTRDTSPPFIVGMIWTDDVGWVNGQVPLLFCADTTIVIGYRYTRRSQQQIEPVLHRFNLFDIWNIHIYYWPYRVRQSVTTVPHILYSTCDYLALHLQTENRVQFASQFRMFHVFGFEALAATRDFMRRDLCDATSRRVACALRKCDFSYTDGAEYTELRGCTLYFTLCVMCNGWWQM